MFFNCVINFRFNIWKMKFLILNTKDNWLWKKAQDSFKIIAKIFHFFLLFLCLSGLLWFIQAQTSKIFKYDIIIVIVGIAGVLVSCPVNAFAFLQHGIFSFNDACRKKENAWINLNWTFKMFYLNSKFFSKNGSKLFLFN